MTPRRRIFGLAGVLLGLLTVAARAEDGVLVVHVTYLDKKPLARVRIGVVKEGSTERTGADGKARLRLAAGVKEEQEVTLQVVPLARDQGPWVFISPWNQRVRVPRFVSGEPVSVVLARKADREALLGSSEGRKAIEQSILSELGKLRQAQSEITDEQRRAVLQEQASAYGLKPEEVDAAIRAASQKSQDLYEQGLAALYEKNYPVASERLERSLEARERKLQKVQDEVADNAFFLGDSRYQEGRYHESVDAFKRAAELRGEHPETLNRLGMALEAAGNYSEAELVLNRALNASPKNNSGLDWFIKGNLAVVLNDRGDFAGARQLDEQILGMRRRELGADAPATLTAMSNLALTLQAQGEFAKARQLQEQVLESWRLRLGADHSATLKAMGNLASTLSAQGNLPKAQQLEEQVLESFRRQLGAEHPDTLKAMNNLASTLYAQSNLPRARQLLEQVLESRRRQLGAEHPATLAAMGNLASTLSAQGDLPNARLLKEQVLESRRRHLGADHPDTLAAMNNLAVTLHAQGDLPKARQLQEQVLETLRRQLGADHPATLTAMNNLAQTLDSQGELVAERALQEQVLETRLRLLGPKHPNTCVAEWNLLNTRKQLDDEAGALELEQSLGWLLHADEAQLSVQQREIRKKLSELKK